MVRNSGYRHKSYNQCGGIVCSGSLNASVAYEIKSSGKYQCYNGGSELLEVER